MGTTIYKRKNYKIYKSYKGNKVCYIVHNTDKKFQNGHTHVYNYNLAKIIIYCCIKGEFPDKTKRLENNQKVLESIIRVCSNKYKNKFKNKMFEIQNKETLP